MTKIGLIIPSTTKGLNCKTYKNSPLFKIFLRSFYKTYNNDLEYTIYLVVDNDDPIYSKENEQNGLKSFNNCYYRSLIDLSLFNKQNIENIYKKYNIKYIINSNIYDCEHRYFHLNAIKQNNVKLFIYNKNLFPPYIGEHTSLLY